MAEYYNLLDHAKQFNPNGEEYAVAKVLEQSNPVIKDMPMIESNDESGHTYAVQTGIPEPTWRRAYQGVEPTKHTQKVVHDTYGRMSAYSIVDVAVAEKAAKLPKLVLLWLNITWKVWLKLLLKKYSTDLTPTMKNLSSVLLLASDIPLVLNLRLT